MFEWIHELKCRVNATTKAKSITLAELHERFRFQDGVVDETQMCNTLVMCAIASEQLGRQAEFVELCGLLSKLLPLPRDTAVLEDLTKVNEKSIVAGTVRCARASSIERGNDPLSIKHYRAFATD
jgi:hypothetical protein